MCEVRALETLGTATAVQINFWLEEHFLLPVCVRSAMDVPVEVRRHLLVLLRVQRTEL